LVGTSSAIAALRAQIRHLATFDSLGSPVVPTLLLQGETGTGKGLVAHVIHDSGPRAAGPFVEINCAAIPETMLEAELFGFELGAFTDAKRAKPGLFEAASGGTLLLDEVDTLPMALQGKLLTALEAKRVRRLGAVTERAVDVKLIAATNAALPAYVVAGRFRADLYHRLAVVVLALPPLRERGEDMLVLAQGCLRHYAAAHGIRPKRLSATAEAWLQRYAWPGNVRELNHVMERVTLLHMGDEVDAETLTQLCQPLIASSVSAEAVSGPQEPDLASPLPAEAEPIRQALVQTGGNVARAARLLGVSRDTVRYRMQRYGIARPRPAAPSPPEALEPPRLPSPPQAPEASTPGGFPFLLREGEAAPAGSAAPPSSPPSRRTRAHTPQGSAGQQGSGRAVVPATDVPAADPVWEQKPIAVLALEATWPTLAEREPLRYDPWTVAARWEQALLEKVQGFGGVLLQRTASLLIWVFGLPRALEQLPQRAVHGALAIRQMVAEVRAPALGPCPRYGWPCTWAPCRWSVRPSPPQRECWRWETRWRSRSGCLGRRHRGRS
jgi:transcriptional regulator with AAA-type ATPase domain